MGTDRDLRTRSLTGLVALGALLIGTPALANDFAFGGEASQLQPLEETRVSMVSEDILMELKDAQWWVTANYRFKNDTDGPVTLKVGFPEFSCEEMEDYADCDAKFTHMKTWVEGALVKMGSGEVAKDHPWRRAAGMGLPLGRVHTFELPFKAREELEVRHTFRMTASGGVSYTEMNYITRTGNLWSGPIGEARFTIRTAERPYSLEWPASYTFVHGLERITGDVRESEYLFEMKNWTPTEDFRVALGNEYVLMMGLSREIAWLKTSCPQTLEVMESILEVGIKGASVEHFGAMVAKELRFCRNVPYARHGYPFKSTDLWKKFYGIRTGYEDGYWKKDSTRKSSYFVPNTLWETKLLTTEEWLYIRAIKQAEMALNNR